MIKSVIKVTETTQHRLALQTAATYFVIREVPSFTAESPFPTSPPFQNNNDRSGNNELSRSVLGYVFVVLVIFIILCLILRKFRLSKLQNRQRAFIPSSRDYRSFTPQVELQALHSDGQPYPPYPGPHLTGIPAAYMGQTRPSRRARATDIDSNGRRLGSLPVEMDHDGELGAKDDLPAYDNFGGPPKYFELNVQNRNQAPLGMISHTPNVGLEDTNHALPENVDIHTPLATTHSVQVSRPVNNISPPIPPYLENSSTPMTRHET